MRFALCLIVSLQLTAAVVAAAEDDEVVVGPLKPAGPQNMQRFGFPNFEQMVFNGASDSKTFEERLRARTDLQMAELDRVCALSDAQKQKLQLAARGDLQRFLGDVAICRLKFEKQMKNQGDNDPNAFNQAWMDIQVDLQPLQRRISGGVTSIASSLFMKSLPRTLTEEQQRAYQAVTDERQRFRYEANVDAALIQFEEFATFAEDQRAAISKLLLAMPTPNANSQYVTYVIWIRLGSLPREKIEPLFTASQWKRLQPHLEQYRNLRERWIEAGVVSAEDFPQEDLPEMP